MKTHLSFNSLAAAWAVLYFLLPGASPLRAEGQNLVAPGAQIETVVSGFKFTEGPRFDSKGNFFFTDIHNNRIHKLTPDHKLSTFRKNSGATNGLGFDQQGRLLACEGDNHRVTAITMDGKVTVLADKYAGKNLNSPNDLWVDAKNGIYFTDPRYSGNSAKEQDGCQVYYITPDRKKVIRVTNDLLGPNGVTGTRDGKKLYVGDYEGKKTWVYRIKKDGTLSDKKLFAPQPSDGIAIDDKGNVYLTFNNVDIFDRTGKKIQEIKLPARVPVKAPSNLTFAPQGKKTLYITSWESVYSLKMTVDGQ